MIYCEYKKKTTIASIFPEFYFDCCQNPFDFKKQEGKKSKIPREPGSNV